MGRKMNRTKMNRMMEKWGCNFLVRQEQNLNQRLSEPVNSILNVDTAGQTHNNEGEWTVVDKRRKSLKADKDPHRPYPAGRYATPHPSDIKRKIGSCDVYAPPDTSTAEILSLIHI